MCKRFASVAGCLVILALSQGVAAAEIVAFALSPDERVTAVVQDAPYTLEIREGSAVRRRSLPELDELDAAPLPEIAWSADSRYLSLTFIVDEETTGLEIIDANTLKVVWHRSIGSSAWLEEGHDLLVVPDYPIDGTQVTPGLLRVDAGSLAEKNVATDHYFTGELDAGKSVVVGRDVKVVGGLPVYSIARVDLATAASDQP